MSLKPCLVFILTGLGLIVLLVRFLEYGDWISTAEDPSRSFLHGPETSASVCAKRINAGHCERSPNAMYRLCPGQCQENQLHAPLRDRHLIQDAIPAAALRTLLQLAPEAVVPGDGFRGVARPFKASEIVAGIQPAAAARWAVQQPEENGRRRLAIAWARTYVDVARRMRSILVERFKLDHVPSFDFIQLACRSKDPRIESDDADSHPAHADNCKPSGDRAEDEEPCQGRDSAFWRSHTGTLYLNSADSGDFKGGNFYYTPHWDASSQERVRLSPSAGTMIAFSAGGANIHGVEAVTEGIRCQLSVWITSEAGEAHHLEELNEAEAILSKWIPPNAEYIRVNPEDWTAAGDRYLKMCERSEASRVNANHIHPPVVAELPLQGEESSLKIELLSDLPGPQITRIRNFLTKDEMDYLITQGRPKLRDATVIEDSQLTTAKYRSSQSSWLREDDYPLLALLKDRITLITGLSLESAEEFQIACYTDANQGRYEPHHDWGLGVDVHHDYGTNKAGQVIGPRIATFLMYLNSVDHGGATTFVSHNVTIEAEAGTAIFWYNLRPSGEGDELVRHGACPVIKGEKYIMTKWIHLLGNEATFDVAAGMPRLIRDWRKVEAAWEPRADTSQLQEDRAVLSSSCDERVAANRCLLAPLEMVRACSKVCEENLAITKVRGREVLEDVISSDDAALLAAVAPIAVAEGGKVIASAFPRHQWIRVGISPLQAASWAISKQDSAMLSKVAAVQWADAFLKALHVVSNTIAKTFGAVIVDNKKNLSLTGLQLSLDDAQIICALPKAAVNLDAEYAEQDGYIPRGNELGNGHMTIREAKYRCSRMPACAGFTLESGPLNYEGAESNIWFKSRFYVEGGAKSSWISYQRLSFLEDTTYNPNDLADAVPAHADNCVPSGRDCVGTNHQRPLRSQSGILFLHGPETGDFSGGDFFYTPTWESSVQERVRIKPQPGRLVTFSSGPQNIHGVEEVVNGTRCTLAVWLGNHDSNSAASDDLQTAWTLLGNASPAPLDRHHQEV